MDTTIRRRSPEMARMVAHLRTITDATVVYKVTLERGETAATVRKRLTRAAAVAGVPVAVRAAPGGGFYVGLLTPERRSKAGRRPGGVRGSSVPD